MDTTIVLYRVEKPYIDTECSLGEGPYFRDEDQTLRFVDIIKRKIYWLDIRKGPSSLHSHQLDISAGCTTDSTMDKGSFIFGGKYGMYRFTEASDNSPHPVVTELAKYPIPDDLRQNFRANDGGVDPAGHYWIAVMNDDSVKEPTNEAFVLRYGPDPVRPPRRFLDGLTIPNGIAWSPDGSIMYLCDSPSKNLYAFDFDVNNIDHPISNQRVLFHLEGDGVPDGHAVDVEGCIWQAIYGGGKVLRISPEGRVLTEIHLPTRCVTCPTFAGTDLYITTAEEGNPKTYPESARFGGRVFRCHVGVEGLKLHRYNHKTS
ncbi:hypothetical protein P152DRAFT_510318 [Eremomyces bilateralis CBS 781.70]|uniref:SMP-30/Gluconolactonase/LRE-like region domain-containing protein n=1 Tax=Eremomyces bilateralis CBS 781.70 TaxID=1392243 RepID=A0A6G1GGF0_9PEZI|nr:uncharacterized protein P152DRAFT_510318 [Eremomyces bilateralis CBS 781.70]KAF1817006.1 hypothetical protein P152DRAFT_510318 [Eremomyces bilateralis CBS 781.70]